MNINRFTQGVGLVAKVALLGAACWKGVETNTNVGTGNGNVVNENANTVAGNGNAEVNANVSPNTNTNTNSTGEIDTSDWVTYTNEEYGFSFRYPKELFVNYTSEENFPFSRTKISEAPIERLEDHFEATQGELNAEETEIKDAVVDNKFYILLPSGIKVKTEI